MAEKERLAAQSPSCVVLHTNHRFASKLALGATSLKKTAVQAVLVSLTPAGIIRCDEVQICAYATKRKKNIKRCSFSFGGEGEI